LFIIIIIIIIIIIMDTMDIASHPVKVHPAVQAAVQEVNVLPSTTPQDVERKIKALEVVCDQATKKIKVAVEERRYDLAHDWQVALDTATNTIAELRKRDSISLTLRHGFAVGTGFPIQIEKNPLTEFDDYDKVKHQEGFEEAVEDFSKRMAEDYKNGDYVNSYIKHNGMVKGHIKKLKERKSVAFAKLKEVGERVQGIRMTPAEQTLYGGLNDAILALLHCLATTTNSDLIDYFSDLLATSSDFINP